MKRNESQTASLGLIIKVARTGMGLSLRAVEEMTDKEISNAYLSQLETGKITKPSPHILYTLSNALDMSYETLMERAGYIVPSGTGRAGAKHGKAATFSIDSLTIEEEKALLEHLQFMRWKNKKK